MLDLMVQEHSNMVLSSIVEILKQDFNKTKENNYLLAFLTCNNPNSFYYPQAMHAHDKDKILATIHQEIEDHTSQGHWKVVHK